MLSCLGRVFAVPLTIGDGDVDGPPRPNVVLRHGPNAQATISGNSWRKNASPCDPRRSVMTTSAPSCRSAVAHRVAFSWKNGSRVPATKYARGGELGIATGGR